jgi:hypothetical protein
MFAKTHLKADGAQRPVNPPSTPRKIALVICVPTDRAADCATERTINSPVDMR